VAHYQALAPTTAVSAPRLLFLGGRLATTSAGTHLEVLQLEAVPGDLKAPEAEADTPEFLRVSQLGSQGQVLALQRLPHPLRRHVEHVADDQRTFVRSEVQVPTAEFFVRLALQPGAVALRVEEIVPAKTTVLAELSLTRL